MADTKTTITVYGIIGILVASGLGVYMLTPEQLAAASTCTTSNMTGIFERFSATNGTAYWTVNGTTKSSVCSKGKWIPTLDWLKLNNLTSKDISISTPEVSNVTEDNVEIISIGQSITVDRTKAVVINGQTYNLTYLPKTVTKCICERIGGCKLSECVAQ